MLVRIRLDIAEVILRGGLPEYLQITKTWQTREQSQEAWAKGCRLLAAELK
jgi:hypothetical protein